MHAQVISELTAQVSEIAAAIAAAIGVERLVIEATEGYTNAVVGMALGREVGHHHQPAPSVALSPHEADHRIAVVVAINPLEAIFTEIIAP